MEIKDSILDLNGSKLSAADEDITLSAFFLHPKIQIIILKTI